MEGGPDGTEARQRFRSGAECRKSGGPAGRPSGEILFAPSIVLPDCRNRPVRGDLDRGARRAYYGGITGVPQIEEPVLCPSPIILFSDKAHSFFG
jgi:hypothetical protein